MERIRHVLIGIIFFSFVSTTAQELVIMDRFDGHKVVNDSVVSIFSSDTSIIDLTKYFVMVNNTDRTLALFLRKTVHTIADSTTDYFCFGPKCWPDTDTTDLADSLQPGVEDDTFASHVVHVRRFDFPPLPPGFTSITYTIFDNTTFSEPIEASVTVNYHLSPVGLSEHERNTVSVYPNPASNWLTVRTTEHITGNVELRVYSNIGDIVIEKHLNITNGYTTLPVGGLRPGLYFGKLIAGNGHAERFTFLVGPR